MSAHSGAESGERIVASAPQQRNGWIEGQKKPAPGTRRPSHSIGETEGSTVPRRCDSRAAAQQAPEPRRHVRPIAEFSTGTRRRQHGLFTPVARCAQVRMRQARRHNVPDTIDGESAAAHARRLPQRRLMSPPVVARHAGVKIKQQLALPPARWLPLSPHQPAPRFVQWAPHVPMAEGPNTAVRPSSPPSHHRNAGDSGYA